MQSIQPNFYSHARVGVTLYPCTCSNQNTFLLPRPCGRDLFISVKNISVSYFYSHARVGVTNPGEYLSHLIGHFYSHARVGVTASRVLLYQTNPISTPTPVWA